MSVFDRLARKATSEVGDKSPKWVDDAAKRIRDELPKGDAPEAKAVRETGEYALGKLEKAREPIGRLGEAGATAFFGYLAMGDELAATRFAGNRLAFLRERAGWAELDAEVDAAAIKTLAAKKDQDAAVALAKDVGSVAAKQLLPFLLSTLVAL